MADSIKTQGPALREKSPATARAVADPFFPGHVAAGCFEDPRLVGGFAGGATAEGAFAQFLLRPVLGLLADLGLDELAADSSPRAPAISSNAEHLVPRGRPSGEICRPSSRAISSSRSCKWRRMAAVS